MICPECKKLGKKSLVYPGACMSTLLAAIPYYDEDGNYHFNDPNTVTQGYSCSNGHHWSENLNKDGE